MRIINLAKTYFTNKQLEKFCELFQNDYKPRCLIVFSHKWFLLLFLYLNLFNIEYWKIIFNRIEGICYPQISLVCLYVFSESYKDYSKSDKRLYSLHTLCHEFRHVWQFKNKFHGDKETDADKFATSFMNNNSHVIAQIMKFKHEHDIVEIDDK